MPAAKFTCCSTQWRCPTMLRIAPKPHACCQSVDPLQGPCPETSKRHALSARVGRHLLDGHGRKEPSREMADLRPHGRRPPTEGISLSSPRASPSKVAPQIARRWESRGRETSQPSTAKTQRWIAWPPPACSRCPRAPPLPKAELRMPLCTAFRKHKFPWKQAMRRDPRPASSRRRHRNQSVWNTSSATAHHAFPDAAASAEPDAGSAAMLSWHGSVISHHLRVLSSAAMAAMSASQSVPTYSKLANSISVSRE
mmetsp:Transcript_1786/g.7090  ORF Transcript_1786/g.7090 Transcript_1786/m.7090 type:complete len:254 (-) Transcript_1786:186-947(-)